MLESLVAWVLKYFLGRYVENLNTDQLTIGLLQGEVELDNLPLKKEALRQVGLPIQVTAGFIGKVKLQIPLTQIRSAPWVILIEQVYLVAAPVNLQEWDEDADEQAFLEQKLSVLDAIEAQWRSSTEGLDQGYYASSYTSWMNFGTSVVSNIVENLQLNINDVHIRYEDYLTFDHNYFTFGIVVESLVAQSCNENWERGCSVGDNSYKLVELSNLSVYWEDCDSYDIIDKKEPKEFIAAMAKSSFRGSQFLVKAVSGKVNMKKNRSADPLRSKLTPRIICDILFDDFPVSLTTRQYSQMVICLRSLDVLKRRIAMRHIRPSASVSDDPKKWWHYFYLAVVESSNAASCKSWDYALKRARDNVAYVLCYQKILLNPAGSLTEVEKLLKDRVELEQSLDELRALRISAMLRVRPITKPNSPTSSGTYLSTWFPQFWYSSSAAGGEAVDKQKLNEEFIEALENPMDDAMYLKRDIVFGHFNFCLKQGTVTLCTFDEAKPEIIQTMLELQLEKFNMGFEWRPRNNSFKLTISLGAVFLKDMLTEDSIFPILVSPQSRELSNIDSKKNLPAGIARLLNRGSSPRPIDESLLDILFEVKPFDSNVDCRVHVKTQSLDVVYNPAAFTWLTDFFTKPQQLPGSGLHIAARRKYQAFKAATKNELIKNWEEILAGKLSNRKTWHIDLDISAPHIIFVEHFVDKNAVIVVVDLGKLHFANHKQQQLCVTKKDSEDEDAFETPCSTPPGSEASPEEITVAEMTVNQLNETGLRSMLYEHYDVELADMQVLVGRVKDSWKYAQLKGTSTLHVLDRFNITMQVERRILYTVDPQYPSLTFSGKLPRLVVHVNEQKVSAIRAVYNTVMIGTAPSPSSYDLPLDTQPSHLPNTDEPVTLASRLIIMQFTIQHLALEVQSRNRSVAELQVTGVRACLTQRMYDLSVTLSVHSLLLVDAMQTFGRDFELLVASHKHVGMDSVSGSLRDSEPCSPTSPASPEPGQHLTSPIAISQALTDLERFERRPYLDVSSPTYIGSPHDIPIRAASPDLMDAEALIVIEITFIKETCPGTDGQPQQIAAVQFNNLDVIANQETIVELIGFVQRVFPPSKGPPPTVPSKPVVKEELNSTPSDESTLLTTLSTKTEATFDFHRLNVLLLRASMRNGVSVGKKICTATMMQAKIKVTVAEQEQVTVEGSLGGIQVLDLTPEGLRHSRILCLGADPLAPIDNFTHLTAGLYRQSDSMASVDTCEPAFSFTISRSLKATSDLADVKIRLASVWYTHSPVLLRELQSCASEFKQYLANLARSIRSAATEVALGLVHARAEALAHSLSVTSRFSSSIYGGSNPDVSSPRKRRRSFSQSLENVLSTPHTPFATRPPHTPWSPDETEILDTIVLNLDIVLDSPVIVLPKASDSDHVFVAHLGKMTLKNKSEERENPWEARVDSYYFFLRDMNVYSVEAAPLLTQLSFSANGDAILPRPENVYCTKGGTPILHDTVVELTLERYVDAISSIRGSWDINLEDNSPLHYRLSGGLVGPLKLSLSRTQYQQIIETSDYMISSLGSLPPDLDSFGPSVRLDNISEEDSSCSEAAFTLHMPKAPSNILPVSSEDQSQRKPSTCFAIVFEVPEFTVTLVGGLCVPGEGALVSISFRDFLLNLDRSSASSHLKMSLKSLVMENLLVEESSKGRFLVISSAEPTSCNRRLALSQSCPSIPQSPVLIAEHNSLPGNLTIYNYRKYQPDRIPKTKVNPFGIQRAAKEVPSTPPPSPRPGQASAPSMSREENLVLITVDTSDQQDSEFYRNVSVDFNCLDIIANIESWVVVLDFFDFENRQNNQPTRRHQESSTRNDQLCGDKPSKFDVEIRGLTLIMIRPEYEVCKISINHLSFYSVVGSELSVEGRLGSMTLFDLSPHGKLYRERFLTTGKEALNVKYIRHSLTPNNRPCESELSINMTSVVYVHTQRFLNELFSYFHRFSQLQTLMTAMRSTGGDNPPRKPSSRMLLSIAAGSPVLILPVASNSAELVVAELGELSVSNGFRRAGSVGTIASCAPEGTVNVRCLLDSMSIELVNMDVYTGCRVADSSGGAPSLQFGGLCISRNGPPLLHDKCRLKLQVDRNLDTHLSREVPDITILGTLSKLEALLDLSQYKVIRGLLSYNIGENLQDLAYVASDFLPDDVNSNASIWRTMSINLDLVNVVLHLREKHGEGANLACVNFIRSRLVVDIFSDRSQDIDLVSAEILLTDTRYRDEPANKRFNVFTNILQPMGSKRDSPNSSVKLEKKTSEESDDGVVQAEVHHRRRKEYSKTTVLLHNMRVMAILDWWELVQDFITQNADEPGSSGVEITTAKTTRRTTPADAAAYVVGLGVADKYPPTVDVEAIPFELKLNVTDSEIVLVEDTAAWDTNAVILKSTTVISYRPGLLEKPLSCNLNHCEVFSCLLGMEDDTALSIIDPVTVNMEVALRGASGVSRGISDAVVSSLDRSLEVTMTSLNIRLSYHDFRMLSIMLESVPQQTKRARDSVTQRGRKPANFENQIMKLAALGFDTEDCANALEKCNGQLDDAALWLTQNASHAQPDNQSTSSIAFHAVDVKVGSLSVVVIDDCRDADVPLLEMTFNQLAIRQILGGGGTAKFSIFTEYYNRVLSGWEPFVEPWRCKLKWEQSLTSGLSRNRLHVEVGSDDLANVNITSTLLDLFSTVKNNWTEDYSDASPVRADKGGSVSIRRRSPFVPFALRNETGCQLWFTTLIKTSISTEEHVLSDEQWIQVDPDQTVPFTFDGRERSRHRDTHKVRVHQISVKAGVWGPVSPVSIDKVGVVFRHAAPLTHLMPMEVPPARLVFSIALEGSARKLITVRSALTIHNNLTEAVEAKLENTVTYPGVWDDTVCVQIPQNASLSVPLSHAHAHIWIRPVDSVNLQRYHAFSSLPVGWMSVQEPKELVYETHECHNNRDNSFRFVAGIYHEGMDVSQGVWMQPAHSITLYSPVVVTNLLPCDLHYSLRQNVSRGYIKPGMSANIHEVDYEQRIEINLQLDGFPRHGTVSIPSPATSFRGQVSLYDESQRRLFLNVAIDVLEGAGVRISVSAPFWIINKTSLPLVVRQEGTAQEAAGQGPEVEVARVVSPLLFSIADTDGGQLGQIRVGLSHLTDAQPQWCQPFTLHVGTDVLRLRIMQRDRPDVVYILGINIRAGKGRHRRTKIITLSPRFQLHNKSSFQLQFAQHCLATTLNDPAASATYCKAVQECSLAWHWPRLDRKLLLCIRLVDVRDCLWSGGFAVDTDDSFHINVRDVNGRMFFLRAEIVLQGATYFTVITDAETMPPPVRVDNCSHVAVEFYQVDTKIETARTIVRPQSSVAYAWDLPRGSTKLAVVAPGGGCATYEVNTTSYKSNVTLTYENFIYIAFTATFNNVDEPGNTRPFERPDMESQQLVLDCVDGRHVILNRKLQGQRSQLWCMTSDGQLQHEGSSPPRDPKSKSARSSSNTMVLDIAGPAPQPSQCVSLVLRRPDPRRASTQTWRFTEDGRLCCAHSALCVQAKDGFFGVRQGARAGGKWQLWSEVVLGPRTDDVRRLGVPIEQAVSRMKMRPGSGCLAVSVMSDGPTRVLRLVDPMDNKMQSQDWMLSVPQEDSCSNRKEFELDVRLSSGVGISVVSREPPEELLYIHLKGIIVNMGQTPTQTTFDCSIEDLQCDNQLFEPGCPVVLYVTRYYREDEPKRHLPAVLISAHKQHSLNTNAHIFKHLIVTLKSFSLSIEELLLLKLCAMFSIPGSDASVEDAEESDFETQRRVIEATSVHAARYYFGIIKFTPDQIRLTFATSPKLPATLQAIKKKLGLRLIKFEDATVELKEFKRRHPFETSQCLWGSAVKHLKSELTWQAAAILGTVDFLGNPLGLINDVSEGVTGFLTEGNVGTLVKSVTHGLSNSAAKVTGSLSDGLGRVILDEGHEERRQRIRTSHSGSSRDHLWAGVKGFGFGLLGGVTSLVKLTYEGAAQEGLQGLVAGLGKGLVGTVTKPVVGVLDFASEAASAVRDSSRTSDRPPRCRLPRLVLGPGGLLPTFSHSQALGQDFLYSANDRDYSEKLSWYEVLLSEDDLRILISSKRLLLFTSTAIQAQYHLNSVSHSKPITIEDPSMRSPIHYVELVLHLSAGSGIFTQEPPKKRPRIRCETRDIAERVCNQINYAQALFEELMFTISHPTEPPS